MLLKLNCCRRSLLGSLVFSLLVSTGAAAGAAPLCVELDSDPDGDGWGWENSQSCIFVTNQEVAPSTPVIPVTPLVPSVSPISDHSVCSSQASDPDGDGWGWENGQSCMVGEVASVPVLSSVPVSGGSGIPACVDATSDPDNDGWGWENGASCIAGGKPALDPLDKVVDIVPATATPVCSAAVVDDNSDGWGWENNQSCLVSAKRSLQKKIMAVGDSITHGVRGQTSYREPLKTLLTEQGCDFTLVGSQTTNKDHDGFTSLHEGYSGHTADHFLMGHTDSSGNNQGIAQSMASFAPDVVLLHIGTNDMRLEQSIDDTVSEIDQIVSSIHQSNSDAIVLLANLIPWYLDAQAAVETLGDKIEAYVTQLANPLVKLVDVRSGYTLDLMIWDRAHPNAAGDAHIADAFFSTYDDAGLCGD